MTEIRIVDIKLKPWWKFWTHRQFEVTVEDEQGNRKTLSIYDSLPTWKSLFKEYIEYKYCTGNQFWDVDQKRKRAKKAEKKQGEPKLSKNDQILMRMSELVGESFDCAVVMSKEAEGQE